MTKNHVSRTSGIDPDSLILNFSPEARVALSELSGAVHSNKHFDEDMKGELRHWAAGLPRTVSSIMTGLPAVAEEVSAHIRETNDKVAERAWLKFTDELAGKGFTLNKRTRSREA